MKRTRPSYAEAMKMKSSTLNIWLAHHHYLPFWRKEHGTTVRVASSEQHTLKDEIRLVRYI